MATKSADPSIGGGTQLSIATTRTTKQEHPNSDSDGSRGKESPSTVVVSKEDLVKESRKDNHSSSKDKRIRISDQQQQQHDANTTETTQPARKRPTRRSNRDTNRILLSSNRTGALQFRRMEELFFHEEPDEQRRHRRRASSKDQQQQQTAVTRRIGKLTLDRVFGAPNIYVIDNFLTAADLEYLQQRIQLCQRQFQKSFVDSLAAQGEKGNAVVLLDDTHRTSTFLSFAKQEDGRVSAIERKAASLLGYFSTDQIEPLQLVRYLPGQFFGVHHDMGDLDETTGQVELPPKSVFVKRRLVTIFCYLNDLPRCAGGCTNFPACDDLRVQPKAGRAVLFCNVRANGMPDPRTVHAGETVVDPTTSSSSSAGNKTDGKKKKKSEKRKDLPVKYGLNIWICES